MIGRLRNWLQANEALYSFVLHVLTGFLAVGAHYSVMWLLIETGTTGVPASAIGFLAGAVVRFVTSYFKVFSPGHGVPVALWRFVIALAFQWVANIALLKAFLLADAPLWGSQVAVTVLLTVVNFLVYRWWVFRSASQPEERSISP
jgi:putative flippase GtrA